MESHLAEKPTRADTDWSLLGLLRTIHAHRRPFLALALGLPLVTALVVLFVPNRYTAQGTILLEVSEATAASDLMGQLSMLTGIAPQAPTSEIYLAILKSRRVGEAVARALDLPSHFGIEAPDPAQVMELTLLELGRRVAFETPDAVSIRIRATDPDPRMAAAMVNAYLDQLQEANQTLALSRARRTRKLVEKALAETTAELDSLREAMRSFQETYGVIALDEQTKGTLELLAGLQTKLLELETQRDALAGFQKEGSAELRRLDLEIASLRKKIAELTGRFEEQARQGVRGALTARDPGELVLPLARIPELADRYARLLMQQKVLEAKYNVLATRLEQTKIEESQSLPSFEILDRAVPPFRKSGPNRKMFVLGALLAGILAGTLLAVFLEDVSRRLDPAAREELARMLPAFLRRPPNRGRV
jgi:uncharacterized protein involved in exopolysaccharide biosynthesis